MQTAKGLTESEAKLSREKYGSNGLTQKERTTFLKKFIEKFNDPIIIILLAALGINVVFTFLGKVDWFECFGIFLSVMIATTIGAISEYKNEATFDKIQQEASRLRCKVYRDGALTEVLNEQIVVGDTVLLQAGDMVPADGSIVFGEIRVNQSALNGESKEVLKKAGQAFGKKDFWDTTTLFRGTVVVSGQCEMLVSEVGDSTVYGRLNRETQTADRKSPLQIKLANLAAKISVFGYIGAGLVMILCMGERIAAYTGGDASQIAAYFGNTMQLLSDLVAAFILGVAVIVMAVPEGLPLMIAIVCSLNMKKMMKNNVLVRKLIGIETAGSINILFSDKTGTITKGKLEAISFCGGDGKVFDGFQSLSPEIKRLVYISATGNTQTRLSGRRVIGGNATEKALIEFVMPMRAHMHIKKKREILFSSENKFSATEVEGDFCGTLIKGAPERILNNCTGYYDPYGKRQSLKSSAALLKRVEDMARRSVRVLALATAEVLPEKGLPQNLTLVGLVGIRDDLRPEVKNAVAEMNRAGIQTVMITGDKKETALAIAKEAGIWQGGNDIVLTSDEMNEMSDDRLAEALTNLKVVARAMPSDKSRLVRLAQSRNMVAGMTGDGVNDLPALKAADVGFAMGSGTDVAKEAGDIVILDDNFASIKKAVLYGRTIYNSIKKFVAFQLTINIAAVAVSVLGPIIGIERPLGIVQMLWVNLCMDTLAAIAFGGEAALSRYMLEKPRRRDEDIIDKKMWSAVAVGGIFISAVSTFMFISQDMYCAFRASENDLVFYTGYFSYFVFSCIFNAFNSRTDELDLTDHISLNKPFIFIILLICIVQILMICFGGAFLGTAPLTLKEWATVIVMALLIIPVDIARKLIVRRI